MAEELAREADTAYEELARTREPRLPQRPQAIAYAVAGEGPKEVLVPGDATVLAVDGRLVIYHGEDKPVQAILQVKPWGAGE